MQFEDEKAASGVQESDGLAFEEDGMDVSENKRPEMLSVKELKQRYEAPR